MIVSDALRPDVLGCYGGEVKTPNIDWLAGKGVLFENVYSTAPFTMPSSVSMFAGSYSRSYGFTQCDELNKNHPKKYSFYVNDSERLFAEVLRENGYDVYMDVENIIAKRSNNLQGFENFRNIEEMREEEIALVEKIIGIKNIGWNKKPRWSCKYDRLYDFLYYLLTVPNSQNFFLMKWFMDPHFPYNPPEKFREKIQVNTSKLSMSPSFYRTMSSRDIKGFSDYEKYFYLKELYKAEVESVDERVGYIIKALKHREVLDKTFIVFTSDHGELFGEHGRNFHVGIYYEPAVRVPLIIMGPGIPKGKRKKTIISHLGLIPTLKDLLSVTYADNMQGKSYYSLFHGGLIQDRISYFDMATNSITKKPARIDALLMDGYKLVVNNKNDRYVLELFNLSLDPGETEDVSKKKPKILKKMYKKIQDLRRKNKIRFKQNLVKIDKNVDLDKELKKTMEHLRTLGYLKK